MRLFAPRSGNDPERSVVTFFLLIHRNANKSDPRTVGRDLDLTDPNKVEEVFLGDVSRPRRGGDGSENASYRDGKDQLGEDGTTHSGTWHHAEVAQSHGM